MHRHNSPFEGEDFDIDQQSDEDPSVEDVLYSLEQYNQQLLEAGVDKETVIRETYETDESIELSEEFYESIADGLRSVWGRLGLRDVNNITAERMENIDPQILLELDEYRAECVYFDTEVKIWEKLGSEPLTVDRVLHQMQPPNKPSRPAKPVNLSELQGRMGGNAADLLRKIKIDSEELLSLALGTPAQRQNIIRLAYVISEEPALPKLRKFITGDPDDPRPETLSIKEVLDRAVGELAVSMRKFIFERSQKGAACEWEAIDYEQYNRALQHAYFSLRLIDRIRKDMEPK